MSGSQQRNNDNWVIIPPKSVSPNVGVIMCNLKGKVIWMGNNDMIGNIDNMGKYNLCIPIPDISTIVQDKVKDLQLYRRILNVDIKAGIYGVEFRHVYEVVHFI